MAGLSPENAGEGEGARCAYQKMQEIRADSGVLSILSGKLHTTVDCSPETLLRRWALVAASLVVPVHKKINGECQRVRQVTGKQGRRMRGVVEG